MSEETRDALNEVEDRLQREVGDLRKILAADLPAHVRRSVRLAFERSPRADLLEHAQLSALKSATGALAEALSEEALAPFAELGPWTWPRERPFPPEAKGLRDHPALAAALERLDARLEAFLGEHALDPAELGPERAAYREPAYFVGGLYMKSVVANYWRALADYDALSRQVREQEGSEQRAARRQRWEDA